MPVSKRSETVVTPAQPVEVATPQDYGEWSTKHALLSSTLQLAVPLWIEKLRGAGWEYIQARAKACSQIVGEKGDVILFRGTKKGESAAAFNALAEGIACLAFAPGGVKTFGEHWEACQDEDVPQRAKVALTTLLSSLQKVLEAT